MPVVVDVLRRHDPVALDGPLTVFDAECLTRRCEAVAAIGQHECEGAQIQEMAAKAIRLIGLARCGTFGNQILAIGIHGPRESLERAFAVDVLNRDARPMVIDLTVAVLAQVVPKRERKATRESAARVSRLAADAREVEGKIESHQEASRVVGGCIKLV